MLALNGVEKRFGALAALAGIDLAVETGDVLGIVGPNGSGKTTLLNVVTGVYPPTAGRVAFHDTDITGWAGHRIARLGIARTFQNIRLFPTMTVFDNVWAAQHSRVSGGLFGLLRSRPAAGCGDARRVDEVLEQVGLLGERESIGQAPAAAGAAPPGDRPHPRCRRKASAAGRARGRHDPGRDRGHGAAHP